MLEQLGHDAPSDRDLYMLALDRIEELPVDFRLPSKHFVCLVVGDTRHLGDGDIHRFADTLLRRGCCLPMCMGPRLVPSPRALRRRDSYVGV